MSNKSYQAPKMRSQVYDAICQMQGSAALTFCLQETVDECNGITERYCSENASIEVSGGTITINTPDFEFQPPDLPLPPPAVSIIAPITFVAAIDSNGDFTTAAVPVSLLIDFDGNGSIDATSNLTVQLDGNFDGESLTGQFFGNNLDSNCSFDGVIEEIAVS
jgi:hypothetical protein